MCVCVCVRAFDCALKVLGVSVHLGYFTGVWGRRKGGAGERARHGEGREGEREREKNLCVWLPHASINLHRCVCVWPFFSKNVCVWP